MDNQQIIKEEFESLVKDLKTLYEQSGKRTTGRWAKGLEVRTEKNKGELYGFGYLAGRRAGKRPPKQNILEWLKAKNIRPVEEKMKLSTLAFLIARKIGREGTDKNRHLKVYDEVITPQRIQSIIDRVTEFNVGLFVDSITVELRKLTTNI